MTPTSYVRVSSRLDTQFEGTIHQALPSLPRDGYVTMRAYRAGTSQSSYVIFAAVTLASLLEPDRSETKFFKLDYATAMRNIRNTLSVEARVRAFLSLAREIPRASWMGDLLTVHNNYVIARRRYRSGVASLAQPKATGATLISAIAEKSEKAATPQASLSAMEQVYNTIQLVRVDPTARALLIAALRAEKFL